MIKQRYTKYSTGQISKAAHNLDTADDLLLINKIGYSKQVLLGEASRGMHEYYSWRKHNYDLPANKKVGFYELYVYRLFESMKAINDYLKKTDPPALKSVQKAMSCFKLFNVRESFSYAERTYRLSAKLLT